MQKQKIAASYQQFHVIAHDLDETKDLRTECKAQLGEGVRLADWNDIVAYVEAGGSVDDFIEALNIPIEYVNPEDMEPIPNTHYRISMNGELRWEGDRHYFLARHDHTKREDFLPHGNIDNYHLTLGSWFGEGGYALCYGDPDSTVPPPEPEVIVSNEMEGHSISATEPDTTEPVLTPVVSYQQFHVISHNLSERGDLKAACQEQLGIGVRLADWNDILAYYREGGSLDDFIEALKIPIEYASPEDTEPLPNTHYRVSMNGELRWEGDRHYFLTRHDHTKREGFLSHNDLDNYRLTLGSWFGNGGVALCYGDLNGTVAPPEPDTTEPVETSGG